ncbi:MAG TPA: ASKHA domain-containing protein, partial [Thermoguttaceae bacterium]
MMREAEAPVTFLPTDRTVYVLAGTRLMEAAAEAGIILDSPCGGEGTCGKCRLLIQNPSSPPTEAERQAFSDEELRQGYRLACQTAVQGPMRVFVPETSLISARHQILVHAGETTAGPAGDPPVLKRYVELPEPEPGSDDPDLMLLEKIIGRFEIDAKSMAIIARRMRTAHYRGTAVTAEGRLIDFQSGNTEAERFAVAVDIGTTTLAAMLLDMNTGSELGVSSRLNPQTRFGDDVISRIAFAGENRQGLQTLQETIVGAVNEMIGELCTKAGIGREQIYCLSFSGNTTMQQLFCGVDTSSLGKMPFMPSVTEGFTRSAADLGLQIHAGGRAYIFPIIGGFVGGDTVAGILATELINTPGPTLLVDVGTNGEIVLWANGKLSAASTAAGPAFEGARISCGMRGSAGAIEKVVVDSRLRINVIGNVAPLGLCGSGLIDAAAELLRHRVLSSQGKLLTPDQLPSDVLPDLRRRIILYEGKVAFLLVDQEESAMGRPLVLTQRDFRELQLASGAIRAGTGILLRRAGLKPKDLSEVLIGGGFGNFIRRKNAQRIGLLPNQIEHHQILYRGNTSLAGSRLAA